MINTKYDKSKTWVMDIEANALLAKVTKITCIVFIRADRKKKRIFRLDEGSIDKGIEFMLKILNSKDFYLAFHNGCAYDLGVMYKLYSIDILKYHKKLIDTLLLAQLKYPKFRVAQLPESNKLMDFQKESHSLDVWSQRIGKEVKDTQFSGLTEGHCMQFNQNVLNWLQSVDVQAVQLDTKIISESLNKQQRDFILSTYNIEVDLASEKQLKACKWTLIDYDRLVQYCEQDVNANIDVLTYLLYRDKKSLPTKAVLQLEQYVAMLGGTMTVHGQKIDRPKMEMIKAKNVMRVTQIDLELSDSFEPYIKEQEQSAIVLQLEELISHFTLGEVLNAMNSIDDIVRLIVNYKVHLGKSKGYEDEDIETLSTNVEVLLKPYQGTRNSSRWEYISLNSSRSLLETFVSPVAYTKTGKAKTKKMSNFKETEDGYYYKVPITTSKLKSDIVIERFKPNSRKSILDFLKRKYEIIPKFATDKLSYKLDADWFESLDIPEAKPLAERFKCSKIISECNTILKNLDENDIVHSTFNTNATSTGRMSMSNPSLQNINSDPEFRSCFVYHDNHKYFYSADLESAELFLLGVNLAPFDNGEFLEAVVNGKKEDRTDIHNVNARKAGVSRDESKVLIYSILYKASPLLVGYNLWTAEVESKFIPTVSDDEFYEADKYLRRRTKDVEGVDFIRVKKDFWVAYSDDLTYKYLYGKKMSESFITGFTGLKELEKHLESLYNKEGGSTITLGKKIWFKDARTSLNYTLQGSNAMIVKLLGYFTSEMGRAKGLKVPEDYSPQNIVHDEINLSISDKSINIINDGMEHVNKTLGYKYPMGLDSFKYSDWSMH